MLVAKVCEVIADTAQIDAQGAAGNMQQYYMRLTLRECIQWIMLAMYAAMLNAANRNQVVLTTT